jgi:hypothetical protein
MKEHEVDEMIPGIAEDDRNRAEKLKRRREKIKEKLEKAKEIMQDARKLSIFLVGFSEILDFLGFSIPINRIGNKEHHQESFPSNTQ